MSVMMLNTYLLGNFIFDIEDIQPNWLQYETPFVQTANPSTWIVQNATVIN